MCEPHAVNVRQKVGASAPKNRLLQGDISAGIRVHLFWTQVCVCPVLVTHRRDWANVPVVRCTPAVGSANRNSAPPVPLAAFRFSSGLKGSVAGGQEQVILSGKGVVIMTTISYAQPCISTIVRELPDTAQSLSSLPAGGLAMLVLLPLEQAFSEAGKRTKYGGKPKSVRSHPRSGNACCCHRPAAVRWLNGRAGESVLSCVG